MNKLPLGLLVLVLAMSSLWDSFTTIYGTYQIFGASGGSPVKLIASVLFGLLVLSLMLSTKHIFRWKQDAAGALIRVFWLIAAVFDVYTTWTGNQYFVFGNQLDKSQLVMLVGFTALISGSPLILSLIIEETLGIDN